jgi:hypothetical protein
MWVRTSAALYNKCSDTGILEQRAFLLYILTHKGKAITLTGREGP